MHRDMHREMHREMHRDVLTPLHTPWSDTSNMSTTTSQGGPSHAATSQPAPAMPGGPVLRQLYSNATPKPWPAHTLPSQAGVPQPWAPPSLPVPPPVDHTHQHTRQPPLLPPRQVPPGSPTLLPSTSAPPPHQLLRPPPAWLRHGAGDAPSARLGPPSDPLVSRSDPRAASIDPLSRPQPNLSSISAGFPTSLPAPPAPGAALPPPHGDAARSADAARAGPPQGFRRVSSAGDTAAAGPPGRRSASGSSGGQRAASPEPRPGQAAAEPRPATAHQAAGAGVLLVKQEPHVGLSGEPPWAGLARHLDLAGLPPVNQGVRGSRGPARGVK